MPVQSSTWQQLVGKDCMSIHYWLVRIRPVNSLLTVFVLYFSLLKLLGAGEFPERPEQPVCEVLYFDN